MPSLVVVGAQWGDEGKGKVVDLYAEQADVVVRYGGGANAGHTLVIDGVKLVTHLLPSGILHPGTLCVLADGMVIEPETLLEEIAAAKTRGLLRSDADLLISRRAHVILPYHKQLEALREKRAHAIGTTLRGIGPAYEAKAARRGIRIGDLAAPARLAALIEQNLDEVGAVIRHLGGTPPAAGPLCEAALAAGARLAGYVGDAGATIDRALAAGKNVLFEGAQGTLLDLDHGTYPFVTSSATVAAGACLGAGIGPGRIDGVIGIAKAYTTRVGAGPFPTELPDADARALREAGSEFGATTGRPRRCGWLDVPALRLAVRVNGLTGLALTKLDVLCGLPAISVCISYRLDGQVVSELPMDAADLDRLEPEYETFPGWTEETSHARTLADLPPRARAYVEAIAARVGVDLVLVSVGPERNATIRLGHPFRD
jgi:adenylosuccinate synthase